MRLPQDIAIPHPTAWATAMVGGAFTMVFVVILLVKRRMRQDPSTLVGHV